MPLKVTRHFVDNGAGHDLAVRRISSEGSRGRPVVLVPGYGMNSFIFGFHPKERSLEATLAASGLVVYSAELRGQGQSVARAGGDGEYGMAELGIDDVSRIVEFVRERESARVVDLVGCSLGTALAFAYMAHTPNAPVGSFVSFGGLVRWVEVPPLLRVAFASPALIGKVRFRRSRQLAKIAFPVIAKRLPRLLSIYVNATSSDLSRADEIVQTVEDPIPRVNEEIAEWIQRRDLVLRGVNVSQAIERMQHPLLCVVAKEDGIVPEKTALDVFHRMASSDKEILSIGGDPDRPIAHADLFLSEGAEARIFEPIARFLAARHGPG